MIDSITAEQVFDAAIRIQVCEKKTLDVDFFKDRIQVRLPPKRALAWSCSVPMSKMTAVLSEMEQDHLIGTEPRGGMWATPQGNRLLYDLLARKYHAEAEVVLGPVVLKSILRSLLISAPGTE